MKKSCLHLIIKTLNGNVFKVNFNYSDTIEELKIKIELVSGTYRDHQRLIYNGINLFDDKTVSEYNI